MLNININKLTNSYTFKPAYCQWAHNHYAERAVEESIDDAISRLIPSEGEGGPGDHFARSPQQIEAFIRAFHNLEPGADIDYSALIEDWPTALDANHFYTQVQEFEESYFRENDSETEPERCDYEEDEEYDEAVNDYDSDMANAVEEESSWAVELITHLELVRATAMWEELRDALVIGELCNIHDDEGRNLVALYLGVRDVLVDGVVMDLSIDSVKIEECLSRLSLAA